MNSEYHFCKKGGSSEDESPVRTYKGHHTKKVEELMKEINPKRLQSTPPPPLLLYTAYRTEGFAFSYVL